MFGITCLSFTQIATQLFSTETSQVELHLPILLSNVRVPLDTAQRVNSHVCISNLSVVPVGATKRTFQVLSRKTDESCLNILSRIVADISSGNIFPLGVSGTVLKRFEKFTIQEYDISRVVIAGQRSVYIASLEIPQNK